MSFDDLSNNKEVIYESHLKRFVNFTDQYLKVSSIIGNRVDAISKLTEQKTFELSHQFQLLATSALEQSQHIQEIIHLAHVVKVNGEDVEMQTISSLLQETFINSITCILEISKQAMVMIYILDDALKTLRQIEKSIHEIEIINHKTKYLSLNATIEAVRAGEAGESFQVVASEVRELSNDTQRLATNIRSQVNEMNDTLINAQDILQRVARIDMSDNILAKDKLDEMMYSLINNSVRMSEISQTVAESVSRFSNTANELITSIQFQDRIQQDFQHIQKDLQALNQIASLLKHDEELENKNLDNLDINTQNKDLQEPISTIPVESPQNSDVILF